jgi:hypothetical protein
MSSAPSDQAELTQGVAIALARTLTLDLGDATDAWVELYNLGRNKGVRLASEVDEPGTPVPRVMRSTARFRAGIVELGSLNCSDRESTQKLVSTRYNKKQHRKSAGCKRSSLGHLLPVYLSSCRANCWLRV